MKLSEYEKLDATINRKFSKLKMEVDEHEIAISELDELVEEKTRNVIKKKLIKQVIEAIQTDLEAMRQKILNEVATGYYDYIKDQASTIIKQEFKKGIRFKHMVIYSELLHEYDPIGMMNNGWRIVYVGPLTFDKNKKDVFIFEKSTKNKIHAKVIMKSKRKTKKKIIRKPK
jgi:hypothetical protein